MNTVEITKKAHKQISKLPKAIAREIYEALETLKTWPDCRNVKSLTNHKDYRLRIGDYRGLFTVQGNTITITEVKKRDEHTY